MVPCSRTHPRSPYSLPRHLLTDQQDVSSLLDHYASLLAQFQDAYTMVDTTYYRLTEGVRGNPEVPKLPKE